MKALVVGGSGSGKSAYAEKLACSLSSQRTYLATMQPHGKEARTRIARHRKQRAHCGFETIQRTASLLPLPTDTPSAPSVVLLDDVGNLVANALFDNAGTMADPPSVHARLEHEVHLLAQAYEHVVIVGNEVGSEGTPYDASTLAWVRLMGSLCCSIAATFDTVIEVTAGIPQVIKGPYGGAFA